MKFFSLSIVAAAGLLCGTSAFAAVVIESRENRIQAEVAWGPDRDRFWTLPPSINYVYSTSLSDTFDERIDASDSDNDHYLNMTPYVQFLIEQTATVSDSGFTFWSVPHGYVNDGYPGTPASTVLYLSSYTDVTFHVTESSIATIDIYDGGGVNVPYVDFDDMGWVYDGGVLNLETGRTYHFNFGINQYPVAGIPGLTISGGLTMNIAAVPEPSIATLLIGGAIATLARFRKRRN